MKRVDLVICHSPEYTTTNRAMKAIAVLPFLLWSHLQIKIAVTRNSPDVLANQSLKPMPKVILT